MKLICIFVSLNIYMGIISNNLNSPKSNVTSPNRVSIKPFDVGDIFNMNYQKIYDSIIQKAKSENRQKGNGIYYESHHIIPKCMGGINTKENRVLLTAREHYICHKILFRLHTNNKKLALAYHSLTYTMQDKRKIKLSSRDFELARKAASLASSGKNNPRYGAVLSKETKEKMSKALTGLPSRNKGMSHSQETRNKISIATKGKNLGVKKSPETRAKMSASLTGKVGRCKGKEFIKKRIPISAVSPLGHYMEFSGAIEMEKNYGLNRGNILACLKGIGKTCKGWHSFKYL